MDEADPPLREPRERRIFERRYPNGREIHVLETQGQVIARVYAADGRLVRDYPYRNSSSAVLAALTWDGNAESLRLE